MADDDQELAQVLTTGVDLILFNRQLEYGFTQRNGAAVIARLKETNPNLKMMLVSTYPECCRPKRLRMGRCLDLASGRLGRRVWWSC